MRRSDAIAWIAVGILPLLASTAFAQDGGDDSNPHGRAAAAAGGVTARWNSTIVWYLPAGRIASARIKAASLAGGIASPSALGFFRRSRRARASGSPP